MHPLCTSGWLKKLMDWHLKYCYTWAHSIPCATETSWKYCIQIQSLNQEPSSEQTLLKTVKKKRLLVTSQRSLSNSWAGMSLPVYPFGLHRELNYLQVSKVNQLELCKHKSRLAEQRLTPSPTLAHCGKTNKGNCVKKSPLLPNTSDIARI